MIEQEFKATAYLADGPKWTNPEKLDVEKVVFHLIEQKIPLLYLNLNGWEKIVENSSFCEQYRYEELLLKDRHDEYLKLKGKFDEHEIPLILFKSDGKFTYRGSDLDAMVRAEDTELIRSIMAHFDYYELPMRIGSEPSKLAYRHVYANKEFYDIEFYQNVVWFVHFADADLLFKRSAQSDKDENITLLSPEDRLISTLAHSIFQQKAFLLSDLVHLRKSLRNCTVDIDYVYAITARKGWLKGLQWGVSVVSKIEKEVWGDSVLKKAWENKLPLRDESKTYYKIPSSITRTFFIRKIFTNKDRNPAQKAHDLYMVLKKFIESRIYGQRRRLFVTFSGIDGSGKSGLIEYVKEIFQKQEFPAPIIIWTRIDSNELFITNTIYKLFKSVIVRDEKLNEVPAEKKIDTLKKKPLIKLAWIYLNTIELLITYIFRIRIPLLLQYTILGDRYYFDAIVDITSQLPDNDINGRFVKWLLNTFSPKPDIVFYLDVKPEIALARKEHDNNKITLEILEKRSRMYDNLFDGINVDNLCRINTNYDFDSPRDIIKNAVLSAYFRKS